MARYNLTLTGPDGDTFEKPIPSVTEMLDAVLAKNGLPDWYYKQAIAGMSILIKKYDHVLPNDIKSLHSLMKQEGLSPYAVRDDAAAAGTRIHTAVEALAKGRRPKDYPELTAWWKQKGFRAANILGAECLLYSGRHSFAGTADLVYDLGEGVTLADIKTGTLRDSHHVQLELYRWAWEEMGKAKIERLQLIQVPRDGGPVLEADVPISPVLTRAAEGLVETYRWLKKGK